ncbi:LysR family transcriptional regulator [Leifsonia aquatica]|uniref:LysR substrate binding domain protein n=2 Tax=Leifsonia aquatica TaxID=144185 RepID=U2T6C1_LEIAQ|nr:LysR family transcriptional regulator [Leifsonia aquatica]ERK70262.1 LysR substrate binding domain protein [Leifsonia aquatica ATCC 14665]MBB2967887.1 DNA-binding transcriptional LysR family regulator [Leifsonia aquatica]
MAVTLRQVEIFLALATELHFGRAADRLHIAQATASQELKRLEVALGLRLFTRSTRTASLTPAGEALVEEARALLDSADRFTDRARLFQTEHLQRVRVVASPSVINTLLPAVIRRAEQETPDTSIEEIAADSGAVVAEVLRQTADIGIGRFLTPPPRFATEVLLQEEFLAVVSAAHPLAGSASIDPADLGDLPLLLWSREQAPAYYDALLALCHDRGLSPMILVSPPRIVGSRSYLLGEGRAFSLVPRSAVPSLPSEVVAVPLDPPGALPLEMIYRDRDPRESLHETVELIRSTASQLLR